MPAKLKYSALLGYLRPDDLRCRQTAFWASGLLVIAVSGWHGALAQEAPPAGAGRSDPTAGSIVLNGSLAPDSETAQRGANNPTSPEQPVAVQRARPAPSAFARERDDVLPDEATVQPVVRDGDFSQQLGPTRQVDGVIDVEPPRPIPDGADPERFDTRSSADRAVFDEPPAGFDPLLFQIEDISPSDPRLNRLPRRFFEREPYDPTGIRFGSFVLFPESETAIAWSSNVFADATARSDHSYVWRPSARLVSNWNVHALELRGSFDYQDYDSFDSEDSTGYLLEARGRVDITRRTNIQGVVSHQNSQESRSAVDAVASGERPTIETNSAALTGNHRFNRLSLQMRGAVNDFDYGETRSLGNNGLTVRNDDRDYVETREAVRASWEFKPTFRVFGEAELVQRSYDDVASSDNISRDSQGGRYRVGVDFGTTSSILRGEISAGYGDHRPADGRLEDIDGMIVDANLAWRATGLTSVLLTAQSDVTETTTANSGGVFERSAALELRHTFRHHLIGSATVGVTRRDFAGIEAKETDVNFGLGVEYFANPNIVLFGTYGHTISFSDFANSDYEVDDVRVGVRLRR